MEIEQNILGFLCNSLLCMCVCPIDTNELVFTCMFFFQVFLLQLLLQQSASNLQELPRGSPVHMKIVGKGVSAGVDAGVTAWVGAEVGAAVGALVGAAIGTGVLEKEVTQSNTGRQKEEAQTRAPIK